MDLPQKIAGINPAKLRDAINAICDYLRSARIVAGKGVKVSRLPGGTVVSAGANPISAASAPPEKEEERGAFDVRYVEGEDGTLGKVRVYDSSAPEGNRAGRVYVDTWIDCDAENFTPKNGVVFVEVEYCNGEYLATAYLEDTIPADRVDEPFYVEVIADVEIKTVEGKTEVLVSRSRPLGNIQVLGRWI